MDDLVTDLLTARLLLHPMTVAEAEQVVAGENGGAAWAPGYPDAGDLSGARRFLNTCAESGDPQPFGAYEIRRREDGVVVGGLGFHGAPDRTGTVTIGYGLVPSVRGQGYATEAVRALLALARSRGVAAVEGDTDLGNVGSQRVMTAVGMRLVREDERLKYYRIGWDRSGGSDG
ncbi:GNAT family N-acetyltransferase [Kitasatospora sp. NPDC101801]|uniref:GNAT family N-acetyltransferase n=1 Tax=Kitasatospora sp. NPDC101801 TaxID=3364103 RepID=UPI0037FC4644